MSPFTGLYGTDAHALLKYEAGSTMNADLEAQLIDRDETLSLLREQLHKAQQLMKQRADELRRVGVM